MPDQHIELIWDKKGETPSPAPCRLTHIPSKDYGSPDSENILIHGDNLPALKALEPYLAGHVKCIYMDPPYNTRAASDHYDDHLEHSLWLTSMRSLLMLLRTLLSRDGSVWIQIDDEEQAYLKVICDEVFGRRNFINMISVNMKNTAGASGGGEDKRLKKNCEYILAYARDYSIFPPLKGPCRYTELPALIRQYAEQGKSWKYTSVLLDPGVREYLGSTPDGSGSEIRIYARKKVVTMSIGQAARRDGITLDEAYSRYGTCIFRTTNAQTSIRTRVKKFRRENSVKDSFLSIEYTPHTGKNRGVLHEQFYKDETCNLLVWLKDTTELVDGKLCKKERLGTYWDMNAYMKNVAHEGGVTFPHGKKPEQLIRQILEMTTGPGELVLDAFLGSGTTAAAAHKLGRKWIGIESGMQVYSHCLPRLQLVIDGRDSGGITSSVGWQGGGGYKFYELTSEESS